MTPKVLNKPIPVQYQNGIFKILINLPLQNGEQFETEIIRPKKILKTVKNKPKKSIGMGGLRAISEMKITGGPKNLSSIIDKVLYQA